VSIFEGFEAGGREFGRPSFRWCGEDAARERSWDAPL
jgi:hypothetical protein